MSKISSSSKTLVPVQPSDLGEYKRRWHAAFPVMMQIGSGFFAMLVSKEVNATTILSVNPSIVSTCAWITLVLGGTPFSL
jgi:hypothetical protein